MKRIIYAPMIMMALLAFAACNNTANEQQAESSTTTTATETAPAANQPPGLLLIQKNDCSGCHSAENKIIGPSWNDIAAKYPNTPENISTLADKVINGSSGVWGQVPMQPHQGLDKDDAKKMVAYILSLKK